MVFNPQGQPIGHIHLPERCANLAFGGAKRNRLFMAASHSIYALYVEGARRGLRRRGPESFHNKETTTMQRRTFTLHALALGAGAALGAVPALAQAPWPTGKTITYLVPFAAGGTTDTLGRLVSQQLGTALGTTVVVDNKGGAGGSVGSEIAARAAPDGYTLLGGTISSHAINVSLYPKLGYDPVKSFAPVTLIGTNPVVLVVAAGSPTRRCRTCSRRRRPGPAGSLRPRPVRAPRSTWPWNCWPTSRA